MHIHCSIHIISEWLLQCIIYVLWSQQYRSKFMSIADLILLGMGMQYMELKSSIFMSNCHQLHTRICLLYQTSACFNSRQSLPWAAATFPIIPCSISTHKTQRCNESMDDCLVMTSWSVWLAGSHHSHGWHHKKYPRVPCTSDQNSCSHIRIKPS